MKNINTVKSKVIKCLEKSNTRLNTDYSETNRLQKTNTKQNIQILSGKEYPNLSIEIQSCRMFGNINT